MVRYSRGVRRDRWTLEQQEERRLCLLIAGVYAAGDYDETAARWVDMALAVGTHNDTEAKSWT